MDSAGLCSAICIMDISISVIRIGLAISCLLSWRPFRPHRVAATNRYPAQVTSSGNLNVGGVQPYSIWSPFGFNGRFYYVKAGYSW